MAELDRITDEWFGENKQTDDDEGGESKTEDKQTEVVNTQPKEEPNTNTNTNQSNNTGTGSTSGSEYPDGYDDLPDWMKAAWNSEGDPPDEAVGGFGSDVNSDVTFH